MAHLLCRASCCGLALSSGIRLVHSAPGRPEGRGKIERAFRTVREQFRVELLDHPPASVDDLNRVFQGWVEQVYHQRVHTETKQTPLERFLAAGAPVRPPSEASLREAFFVVRATDSVKDVHGLDARQRV
jgi:putative transposase